MAAVDIDPIMLAYHHRALIIREIKELIFAWDLCNVIKKLILFGVLCMDTLILTSYITFLKSIPNIFLQLVLVCASSGIATFAAGALFFPVYDWKWHIKITKFLLMPFEKWKYHNFFCINDIIKFNKISIFNVSV